MTLDPERNTHLIPTHYRGRFAPTPSGPLHFGSLVAAMGSYLEARHQGGEWLVRMEDLDPPREVPGAASAILRALEGYGFEWDGAVMYQHHRDEAYREALEELSQAGVVYGCGCSRKQLAASALRGVDGPVYPGTCRGRQTSGNGALRLIVPSGRVGFEDLLQGKVQCDVAAECGDFVLRRADGVFSYQLAVVVDDATQGITHIVRGADLLTSTPRQIVLQRYLKLPVPTYCHLPVALDADGRKLGKQTLAAPIDPWKPLPALCAAMRFLGIKPPTMVDSVADFWAWAREHWSRCDMAPTRGRRVSASPCKS